MFDYKACVTKFTLRIPHDQNIVYVDGDDSPKNERKDKNPGIKKVRTWAFCRGYFFMLPDGKACLRHFITTVCIDK